MKKLLHLFWTHLFPLPVVSGLEGALARVLTAGVVYYFLPFLPPPTVQPVPVGMAHFVDLTWLGQVSSFETYRQVLVALLVVYASGIALPVVLPVLATAYIALYTLINSQGFTNHSHHILAVVLFSQALAALFYLRPKAGCWLKPSLGLNAWMLVAAQAGIASAYLISVLSKLWNSGFTWLFRSHYIALDMVKTMRQNYHSALDPRYAVEPPNVVWMLEHPFWTALLFDLGFVVEALIVLSVGTRKLALLFGVGTILMHRSINYFMGLEFYQNESMLAVFFVNVPFLIACLLGQRRKAPLNGHV